MKIYLLPWWVTVIWVIATLIFLVYLALPNLPFPQQLSNSLQSQERGDTEEFINRRAYFTDMTRLEVVTFYFNQWKNVSFMNKVFPMPLYRINHPPEMAFQAIKDQTRSTFLEEMIHPFRESFYINGFLPSQDKDAVIIDGQQFLQKISVRYVRSSQSIRLILGFIASVLLLIIVNEWYRTTKTFTSKL